MTHDELLTKLWILPADVSELQHGAKAVQALRAVVELHKPIQEDGKLWCQHEACYNHLEFLERDDCSCEYPCPTIQVIEKELN